MAENPKYTLKELVDYFLKMEEEEDLYELDIEGVMIWQYLRFRIFMLIANELGIYQTAHTKNLSPSYLLKVSFSLVFYSLFSNPLFGKYRRKRILLNTGRRAIVDNQQLEIYTHFFIKSRGLTDYEIVEELYELKHQKREFKNKKHQDYQQILAILNTVLSRYRLGKAHLEKINYIEDRISNDLGISIHIEKLIRNGVITFKSDYQFYSRYFRKRQPETVYLICSYGYKMAAIAAAQSQDIDVIELQHGTITSYHIGYRYASGVVPAYFPDKIYLFGEYWKSISSLPIENERLIVQGYPYFSYIREKYKAIKTEKDRILILSQGAIGDKIVKLLYAHLELFNNYKITYKLHPGEYARWEKEYPELVEMNHRHNINVIAQESKNLYQYFAESAHVIGVYSTAVYESLGFGCMVILLNLPGIEYMEDLIKSRAVNLAENFEDVKLLLNAESSNVNQEDFFAKVDFRS